MILWCHRVGGDSRGRLPALLGGTVLSWPGGTSTHRSSRFFLAVAFLATLILATATGAAAFVVDAAGRGDFETLEAALAVAVDGDVIQVHSGMYPTSVLVEASLTIEGLGAAGDVVLVGQGSGRITPREFCIKMAHVLPKFHRDPS